jgi:hypothetical protein
MRSRSATREPLGGRKADPGIPPGDEYDFSSVFGRVDVAIFRVVHLSFKAVMTLN